MRQLIAVRVAFYTSLLCSLAVKKFATVRFYLHRRGYVTRLKTFIATNKSLFHLFDSFSRWFQSAYVLSRYNHAPLHGSYRSLFFYCVHFLELKVYAYSHIYVWDSTFMYIMFLERWYTIGSLSIREEGSNTNLVDFPNLIWLNKVLVTNVGYSAMKVTNTILCNEEYEIFWLVCTGKYASTHQVLYRRSKIPFSYCQEGQR